MKIEAQEPLALIEERLLRDMGRGPFHLSDGVYFWRDRDGVHVAITDSNGIVSQHHVWDKSSWASAVASTTWEGETGTTFRIADALLGA